MLKVIVALIALYGACWYAGEHIDFDKALKFASDNKSKPWAPAYTNALALYYYQKADYPRAQRIYDQLLTEHPTCQYAPKALMRLGDSAESNMDWEKAKEAYARYIQEFPDGKDIQIATKRLEYLKYKH